eukprot:TRINITY_DN3810_c0_g1_i3.p1 TRINITY_DN3810_c0_g1~~TRINITY_DN3810_c0_g1_i3.p1  ORF type:complete len:486 (-),score=40.50 TRINITY_DN3810_c0_g1_i3:116-1573(-)
MRKLLVFTFLNTLLSLYHCQLILEANRQQAVLQISEIRTFVHRLAPQINERYLHIELNIQNGYEDSYRITPVLMVQEGEPCSLTTTSFSGDESNLHYSAIDRNGYYLKKGYHHIVLPLDRPYKNGQIYVCVVNNIGASYQDNYYQFSYTLKASYSQKKPCANNCGGNGKCGDDGQCICSSENLGDEDCTENLNILEAGHEMMGNVIPSQWIYFKVTNPKGATIITLLKSEALLIRIGFKIPGEGGIWMPSLLEGTNLIANSVQSWKADRSTFLLGIFNPSAVPVEFVLKAIPDASNDDIFFALIMLVGFIGAAICILLLAVICLRQFVMRSIRRPDTSSVEVVQSTKEKAKKALEKFCPTSDFSTFDIIFSQTNCSICLEDFERNSKCRQISLCAHIFHAPCIDTWMKQNSSCPVCKKEITEDELVKVNKAITSPAWKTLTSSPSSPSAKLMALDEFTNAATPAKMQEIIIEETPQKKNRAEPTF